MSKSMLILALICLLAVTAGLTATAFAECKTCGDVTAGNWDPSKKLDEIGNSAAQQEPDQPFGPALARQTNSRFSTNSAQDNNAGDTDKMNIAEEKPALNVGLEKIGASPNPANPGVPVKITALLSDLENMTAYAIIKNSFGVQVGNVTLDKSPGGEYIGTWNAGIATGTYNATVVASAQGASKTFADALQIIVMESSNATDSYTKLG